jgi:hypothetical protein
MTAQIKQFSARGVEASLLRQRKYALVRQFDLPENLLGGSLAPTRRRCGKPNCHCRNGEGHLQWSVTFCKGGKKRVERVPLEWLEELEKAVLQTHSYLDAVREVMAINLELLAQTREQERPRRVRRQQEEFIENVKNDQLSPPAIDPIYM